MRRMLLVLAGAALLALGTPAPAAAASPPGGSHDGSSGPRSQNDCHANGWAVDPDDINAIVTVRILVDDVEIARVPANEFRQDLLDAHVSPTGFAGFWVNLWGVVAPDVDHVVRVEALDVGSADTWVPLNMTPRTLRCHEYTWSDFDLFWVDPATGAVKQLTKTPGVSEWNPEAAPSGPRVVYEVASASGAIKLVIKNTTTGATTTLSGAKGGNNGTWTPDGKRIVFDRGPSGDPSLYRVSAAGGTRSLISRNAVEADVSATNGRVVFLNPSTSRIVASTQSGTGRHVVVTLRHRVSPRAMWFDVSPEWSPNGRWIAYADGGDIWKVRVSPIGVPLARPVRVIARSWAIENLPTWSRDGTRILYQANYRGDMDIWSVPASGGTPKLLTPHTGIAGFGDFNASQRAGGRVIYSSQAVVGG